MPKTKKSASPAQIVVAGQPSAPTIAKLKAVGARLTDEQIAAAMRRAEQARTSFQVAAIEAGILLLAKKATMKHGEWLPWCEKFVNRQIGGTPPISTNGRSLREYTFLAQHFLADLEQGTFAPEERDQAVAPPAIGVEEALALQTLPESKRAAVTTAISSFVGGRSLRRMLIDFRRAESAADQEEIEDANRRKAKAKKNDPAGQLDFWAELARPITEIETLFQDPAFVQQTTKEFWIKAADQLDAQAKFARAKAKEIR